MSFAHNSFNLKAPSHRRDTSRESGLTITELELEAR